MLYDVTAQLKIYIYTYILYIFNRVLQHRDREDSNYCKTVFTNFILYHKYEIPTIVNCELLLLSTTSNNFKNKKTLHDFFTPKLNSGNTYLMLNKYKNILFSLFLTQLC